MCVWCDIAWLPRSLYRVPRAQPTDVFWCRRTTYHLGLDVKWCRRPTVNCVSCETKAISLVEHAEPLSTPFEVDQAQTLLWCFSLEPGFVLSDVRLLSSLETVVKSGRGEPLWECSPLLPSTNTQSQGDGFQRQQEMGGGVDVKGADSAAQLCHTLQFRRKQDFLRRRFRLIDVRALASHLSDVFGPDRLLNACCVNTCGSEVSEMLALLCCSWVRWRGLFLDTTVTYHYVISIFTCRRSLPQTFTAGA